MPCDETLLPVIFKTHQSALHFRLAPTWQGLAVQMAGNGRKWQVLAETARLAAKLLLLSPRHVTSPRQASQAQVQDFPANSCHFLPKPATSGSRQVVSAPNALRPQRFEFRAALSPYPQPRLCRRQSTNPGDPVSAPRILWPNGLCRHSRHERHWPKLAQTCRPVIFRHCGSLVGIVGTVV